MQEITFGMARCVWPNPYPLAALLGGDKVAMATGPTHLVVKWGPECNLKNWKEDFKLDFKPNHWIESL